MNKGWMLLAGAVLALAAAPARANCARPPYYDVKLSGRNATIETAGCASCVLLRKDTATQEVVKVAEYVRGADGGTAGYPTFTDTCVPPGSYQYGFDPPYDNHCRLIGNCGNPAFFGTATVPEDAGSCTGSSSATPYSAGVPWGTDNEVPCSGGCGCGSEASVVSTNAVLLFAGLALLALRRRG